MMTGGLDRMSKSLRATAIASLCVGALALPMQAGAAEDGSMGSGAAEDGSMGSKAMDSAEGMAKDAMGQEATFMAEPPSGVHQASNLMGADVVDANGESIGSIADLVLGADGSLKGVVISSGGFLGIGEKRVGVGWNANNMKIRDEVLHTQLTQEEIKAAPAFEGAPDEGTQDEQMSE